jgi:class 3 adenylate cyclase
LAAWQADLPVVRSAVERGLDLLRGSDERPLQARLVVIALAAESDASVLARARRDAVALEEARERAQRLLDAVEQLGGSGETYADREIAAYQKLARAHAARIDGRQDPDAWRSAHSAWVALEQPYQAAVVAWRAGDALLAVRAPRDEVTVLLRDAHQVAEQLNARPLKGEVESLARRARVELTPKAAAEPTPISATAELGLTAREEEVLGLVAMGLTNKQIAESLFISEKTASVHVSNILGKLGVASRVEAAGVAFRLGLLTGPASTDREDGGDARTVDAADAEVSRTLMFTDIARSTDLVEAIGDSAWTELLRWHDATLRSLFTTYGGAEVDHAGDGFFVVFPSTQPAVGCAVAIQRTLAAHRRAHGFAPSVRIGVHRSRIQHAEGAYRGRGVHEAARIAGLADADEILLSRDSMPDGRLSYETLAPREIELKGIRGTVTVVPVNWR